MQKNTIYKCALMVFVFIALATIDSELRSLDISKTPQSETVFNKDIRGKIKLASLFDVTDLFKKLNYSIHQCTKSSCQIPRIVFNKVSKDWQESSHKLPVEVKKELFLNLMIPLILQANENIKKERELVESEQLNSQKIKAIAIKYRVIDEKADTKKTIIFDEKLRTNILQHVDTLPVSLASAQAVEESGWGTSRFTHQGNAFFGQWDYSGKGMKPLQQRKKLGNYGIARFKSPLASVESYMLNINRNRAYQRLRTLRAQLSSKGKMVTGYELASTLDKYSERREAYVTGLREIISHNKLEKLDYATLADNPLIQIIVK